MNKLQIENLSKQILLNIDLWRKILSFIYNDEFFEMNKNIQTFFINRMFINLNISITTELIQFFSKIKIPIYFWKEPISLIKIGQYIAKEFITITRTNKILQNKIRPMRYPKRPESYFNDLFEMKFEKLDIKYILLLYKLEFIDYYTRKDNKNLEYKSNLVRWMMYRLNLCSECYNLISSINIKKFNYKLFDINFCKTCYEKYFI